MRRDKAANLSLGLPCRKMAMARCPTIALVGLRHLGSTLPLVEFRAPNLCRDRCGDPFPKTAQYPAVGWRPAIGHPGSIPARLGNRVVRPHDGPTRYAISTIVRTNPLKRWCGQVAFACQAANPLKFQKSLPQRQEIRPRVLLPAPHATTHDTPN